jgi:probable phosphoglycerate mutase
VVLMARHGETDDNRPPVRVQGTRNTPLNATGRAQAAELAELASREDVRALYCSHLARARETAEVVGARLGLEARIDERFAESHRGEWEGRLLEEIERDEPAAYAAWRRAGESFRFPGGESLAEQLTRVGAALDDVERAAGAPALVVCHGGSIRAALCRRDPRGLDAFHTWDVPNGAVVRL